MKTQMKRRNIQFLIIAISLCFPSLLFAQTAEEIIAKHIIAHGGADNLNNVESIKLTGTFSAFSIEKDYTAFKTKDGCYYADFHLGEQHVIESYNGKKGWTIDPWQEILYARNINSKETDVFQQKAEFFTPFFNYKEKGHTVEYIGKQDIDGTDTYALKLNKTNGTTQTWYLDSKTYLEYKCEAPWVDFAVPMPAEMYFDDFRTVEGVVIPFYTERFFWQRDRVIQLETVEINPKFEKDLLIMPRRKEISKLDFLHGMWDVKMEFIDRRGEWREMGTTESKINYVSTNMLEEVMSYEQNFPIGINVRYTYNSDIKSYQISAFNDFTSNIEVLQGNFTDKTIVFDDTKVCFTDEKNPNKTFKQFSYTMIDEISFSVENKISQDEGKTWKPIAKFTYTRKTNEVLSKK